MSDKKKTFKFVVVTPILIRDTNETIQPGDYIDLEMNEKTALMVKRGDIVELIEENKRDTDD